MFNFSLHSTSFFVFLSVLHFSAQVCTSVTTVLEFYSLPPRKLMEFSDDQVNTFGRSGHPIFGAIFMANKETKRECLKRKLFGLPPPQINFVKKVKSGMILFLFEYEERKLFGVFQASTDGASNIVPNAFKSSGKQFPAQIRFKSIWHCKPLSEHEFGDAMRDNYYTSKKFNLGLSEDQVSELLWLFNSRRIGIQKSKNPLLSEKLLNRSLSSVSGRIGVFEDDECRASASDQSQTSRAIDKPFDLTTYSGLSSSYPNPSSGPYRSILGSDSSILGSQQRLSSSERVNHPYSNLQSSLNSGEFYTNSSGVCIDMKVSPQGFVAYPSSLAGDSLPSSGNQAASLRFGSLDEKSNLGEYIPLEDDPYTIPSSGPGKDPPYVPEYVTPIPVGLRSDIPNRISVFDRLKDRLNISEEADNVLDDYVSEDIDSEYEDALLTIEELDCSDVVVEEPPVNFKRRNKTRRIQDNTLTEESDSLSGNLSRKRRKIFRPSFVSEGTHEKGITANNFPNVEESLVQEITEFKEKPTSETLVIANGGEESEAVPSENFGEQTMVPCEGNEKEPSENFVHQVCSEHNIDKTEFDEGKGGGDANEKEPTSVGIITEISENKDGNSNAKIESLSNSQDFKARVEELVEELKGIQGSNTE